MRVNRLNFSIVIVESMPKTFNIILISVYRLLTSFSLLHSITDTMLFLCWWDLAFFFWGVSVCKTPACKLIIYILLIYISLLMNKLMLVCRLWKWGKQLIWFIKVHIESTLESLSGLSYIPKRRICIWSDLQYQVCIKGKKKCLFGLQKLLPCVQETEFPSLFSKIDLTDLFHGISLFKKIKREKHLSPTA